MTFRDQGRLVFGSGPVARVLCGIFKCPLIGRNSDDSAWHWPKLEKSIDRQFILVLPPGANLSQIVRWQGQVWDCPNFQDANSLIFGTSQALIEDLMPRDVFGRLQADKDSSFQEWANYIAVVNEEALLSELLTKMEVLSECPVETWRAHARRASVVPALRQAISDRDLEFVKKIIPDAERQDWDAVCPHAQANQIRIFFKTVTTGVTPDWKKADAFLEFLA